MRTRADWSEVLLGEQAMDAGDADVGDELDGVAHEARGDGGFFGDGQIAGAGADDGDGSLAWGGGGLGEGDGSGRSRETRRGARRRGRRHTWRGGAGGQDIAAGLGHAGKDGGDLGGGFAGGEDDSGMPVRRAR